MSRRRAMFMNGQEDDEMKEWQLLTEHVNDGTSGENTFAFPYAVSEVMIMVEYNGNVGLTSAWEIISVNGGIRYGIINFAPASSGGRQLFKIIKMPFGFELTGTKSATPTFAGSSNGIYYNFMPSNDEGIEKISFGSDAGKGASSKDVIWKIYYR